MPQSHEEQLARLEQKIDAVKETAEKTKKYVFIMLIATVSMAVLPILLGALALPFMMSTLGSVYSM